jgi:hypothetical protein
MPSLVLVGSTVYLIIVTHKQKKVRITLLDSENSYTYKIYLKKVSK